MLDDWLNLATLAPQQNVCRAEATERSALDRSTVLLLLLMLLLLLFLLHVSSGTKDK